jgi:hypothetical protein
MASAGGRRWQSFLQELVMVAGTVSFKTLEWSELNDSDLLLGSRRRHTSSFAISYRALISTRKARRRRSSDKNQRPFCADLMAEMSRMTE